MANQYHKKGGFINMKRKLGIVFITLGVVFVLYAIFGRYLVLPGYMKSLENGTAGATTVPSDIEGWKVARYLLWAYAFKLGIYFVVIGALIRSNVKKLMLVTYVVGGLVYIGFAYMPIPAPKLLFGLGGAIMTVSIIVLILHLAGLREKSTTETTTGFDLRIFGYFFFAMATYNLCPLLGVKCFALSPEKMIEYGLQADAASFAAHILIELVLGWCFIVVSYLMNKKNSS
jgi:hypothetical protein